MLKTIVYNNLPEHEIKVGEEYLLGQLIIGGMDPECLNTMIDEFANVGINDPHMGGYVIEFSIKERKDNPTDSVVVVEKIEQKITDEMRVKLASINK